LTVNRLPIHPGESLASELAEVGVAARHSVPD
jgi:hypothetical protein